MQVEDDSGSPEVSLQMTVVYPKTRLAFGVFFAIPLTAARTLCGRVELYPLDELMALIRPSQQWYPPSLYLAQERELFFSCGRYFDSLVPI